MIIIQILLRIIYYPIGWVGDLFDFIAGSLQGIDDKIKIRRISKNDKSEDKITFITNGDSLPGHRNPPPPPRKM